MQAKCGMQHSFPGIVQVLNLFQSLLLLQFSRLLSTATLISCTKCPCKCSIALRFSINSFCIDFSDLYYIPEATASTGSRRVTIIISLSGSGAPSRKSSSTSRWAVRTANTWAVCPFCPDLKFKFTYYVHFNHLYCLISNKIHQYEMKLP